jgi:hypothetical protein
LILASPSRSIGNTNPGAATHLFVPETVGRAIQPANVKTLGLRARRATVHDDAVTRFQRFGSHADFRKLETVVHFEPPLLRTAAVILDVYRQEWMWIDEVELGDDTFDLHLPAAVVDTGERMMGVYPRRATEAQKKRRPE